MPCPLDAARSDALADRRGSEATERSLGNGVRDRRSLVGGTALPQAEVERPPAVAKLGEQTTRKQDLALPAGERRAQDQLPVAAVPASSFDDGPDLLYTAGERLPQQDAEHGPGDDQCAETGTRSLQSRHCSGPASRPQRYRGNDSARRLPH